MSRKSRARPQKKADPAKDTRRAQERFAAGDVAVAAKHCRQALNVDPSAADVWHLLAVCLLTDQDLLGASQASQRAR